MENEENVRRLSRDEYRKLMTFFDDNYEEIYANKIGYNVLFNKEDDTFTVSLSDTSIFDWQDIFTWQNKLISV